ncbi:prenyltransferase/squalene oxidase repeat-containing protein, partial [Eggerthella guodeyinii]|uniref:prenyltransferase/squalene oxidase repeat-containing protein n=1 Tax=Eggerthella guodeyinii TaxID=2690837 RepID=UPI0018A1EDCE
ASVGTSTLTIVYGLGWDGSADAKVNVTYPFAQDATLSDLLDAAVAAGDLKAYELNGYGYLSSVTFKDGTVAKGTEGGSLYWSNFVDGGYYEGSDTIQTQKLVDGQTYQFAWNSYPTAVPPTDWEPIVDAAETSETIAGGKASVGTSTLTIVYGLGWDGSADAKVNVTYPFAQDATLSDLLDAAVAAGDLKAYELNGYGYLSSVTFKDGTVAKGTEGGSLYWSNFVDGGYYEGSDTIQTQKLVDGQTYQFAWNSYPTAVPPTDWKPIVAQATSSSQLAGTPSSGSDDVVFPEDTGEASVLTQDVYRDLFGNISASFVGSGEDWKVMELCAIGAASSIDRDALLANAVSSYNLVGTTNPQRSVIALTAAGIDPSHVTVGGETYDLLNKMATTQFNYTNSRIALLWAYASGPYDAPTSALMTVDELLDSLAVSQLPDGGFANSGSTSDPDVTAMAIAALAPYQGRGSVNDVLTKALAALKSMQLSDGGFPRLGESVSNANSTAMASIALCAVGVDPAASWATASGATPMSALLSFANEGHTGFTYANGDAALATEQGFRALVAYQGLKNTGAAYNIYTQAKLGQAALPADEREESDVKPAGAPAADKKALAKTGDGSAPFAAGTAVLALGALAAGIAATRRMRVSDELSLRR